MGAVTRGTRQRRIALLQPVAASDRAVRAVARRAAAARILLGVAALARESRLLVRARERPRRTERARAKRDAEPAGERQRENGPRQPHATEPPYVAGLLR